MQFNSYIWDMYRNSEAGKKAIELFDVQSDKFWIREQTTLYNHLIFVNSQTADFIDECTADVLCNLSDYDKPTNIAEARAIYTDTIFHGIYSEGEYLVKKEDYIAMLNLNVPVSYAMYIFAPEYFFPNLFPFKFSNLKKIVDLFGLTLPDIPKKSDYKARCIYYMELCELLYSFRIDNNLSPSELCAFLYDFAPNMICKNILADMPKPTQAWFIGGVIDTIDKELGCPFWQANVETKRGDILIHYETSPVSAITHMWIAQADGIIDPFFHYYSNTYIGDKKPLPRITLSDLRADSYFSKHSLVRKSFQGVNGWAISGEDYVELLRIISEKDGDVSALPSLYAPTLVVNTDIKCERDVEEQLLEPFLRELNITSTDYRRQLSFHAGRGSKIYADYALFYDDTPNYEQTNILIEAKFYMRTNKDIETAFIQAHSYARSLGASVIVLCDKYCLMIYKKRDGFDRTDYLKYYWSAMRNPDIFRVLQDIFRRPSKIQSNFGVAQKISP